MLSAIRNLARSPLIGGIIIAFLIAAFALWGVEDILRGGRTDAISVGTERVTPQQLNRAFNQRLTIAQQENPRLTREEADRAGLGESVISQLAAEAALNAQARELNLGVSDSRVFSEIQGIPVFRSGFSNRFDRATYNEVLAQQSWTPETFEQQIRTELRRMQMIDSAIAGARAPSVMAEARAAYEAEARTIRALLLPPALAGEIEPPTDEALEGFIAEEAQVFQRPEQRRFSIVRATPDMLAMDADVDEEELRELYQMRLDQGELSEPATRSFALWTVADAETADALIARIEAGEDADAAASELGLSQAARQTEAQAYEVPDQTVSAAVFEMAKGEARALDTRLGLRVAYVEAATDPEVPSYEQARDGLRAEFARLTAEDEMFAALDRLEQARGAGATLEEAAAEARLPVEKYDFVTRNGFTMEGQPLMSLLEGQEILQQVFEAPLGFDTDLTEFGDGGYFVVRVDEIEESRLPRVDEVREDAEAYWTALRTDERLGEIATDALARVRAGETLDAVAADLGGAARVETSTLRRSETAGPFGEMLVGAAFAARQGEAFEARASGQRTRAVGLVTAIQADAPATADASALSEELENDILMGLERSLMNIYEIRPNQAMIDVALGRSQPDQNQLQP